MIKPDAVTQSMEHLNKVGLVSGICVLVARGIEYVDLLVVAVDDITEIGRLETGGGSAEIPFQAFVWLKWFRLRVVRSGHDETGEDGT